MLVVLHGPPFQDRDEPVHHGVNVGRGIPPVAPHTIVPDVAGQRRPCRETGVLVAHCASEDAFLC